MTSFDALFQQAHDNIQGRESAPQQAPGLAPQFDNHFEQVHRRMQQQRVDAAMASFRAAVQTDPDLAGEAQRIGKELGIDPDRAVRSPDVFRSIMRERQIEAQDLFNANPVLAEMMQSLDFAQVAADQVGDLSAWERVAGNWTAGQLEHERGLIGEKVRTGSASRHDLQRLESVEKQLHALPKRDGILTSASRFAGQMSTTLPKAIAVGSATGFGYAAAATVAGQAGPQAAIPEEIITAPAAFLTGLGHGTSAAIAYQTFQSEAGNAYLDMERAGYDPESAKWAAGGIGAASALLEVVGAKALANPVTGAIKDRLRGTVVEGLRRPTFSDAAKDFAINYAKSAGGEVWTEIAQTGAGIVGEEIARVVSEDKTFADLESTVTRGEVFASLYETAVATAQGMVLVGAPGPALRLMHDARRGFAAQEQQRFMESLQDSAQASKVRQRNPDRYEAFLARTVQGTGADTVYVDRDRFEDALRQSGINRDELARELPDVAAQLAESAESRPDVTIPIARYAARLTGTPLDMELRQHKRLDPDGMSAAELVEHQKQLEEMGKVARRQLDMKAAEDEAFVSSAQVVEDQVYREIAATKTMPTAQAKASARLFRDFVVVQSERLQITPEAFHERFPLSVVKGVQPTGGDLRSQRGGFNPRTFVVKLYESADASTFLHEASHFFLTAYGEMARSESATPEMRGDLETLLRWFNVESVEAWNAMSIDEQRKSHETFATGFEQWVHSGEAPSQEQATLFRKLGAWLRRVYRSLVQMRDEQNEAHKAEFGEDLPELSQEVRDVMARMVASEEQIARAREIRGMVPLFQSQQEAGMTDEQWQEYMGLQHQADEAAVEDLTRARVKNMRYLQGARSRVLKELQAKQRKERKRIGEEVAQEVAALPVYRLRHWLRTGKMRNEDGAVQPGDADANHKLATELVQAMVPPGTDTKTQLRGVMAKDGMHPDLAADLFGYDSGQAMVRDLLTWAPQKDTVQARTDERMLAEHAELVDEQAIEQQVHEALHNEMRDRVVAAELKALDAGRQPFRIMQAAAKEAARRTLGRRRVDDINVRDYSVAVGRARKAAREALQSGDARGMREALRTEMVQQALVRLAGEARTEILQAQREFRDVFKSDKKLAKSRDVNVVQAARSILTLFGLGTADRTPLEWLKQTEEYAPDLFAELSPDVAEAIEQANKVGGRWTELTLDEFRDLRDLVASLWFRSRRDKQVVVEGERKRLEDVAERIVARIDEIGLPARRGEQGDLSKFEQNAGRLRQMLAMVTRVENAMLAIDGGTPGIFTSAIWRRVKDAAVAFQRDQVSIVEEIQQLLDGHDMGTSRKIEAPELLDGDKAFVFGRRTGNGKQQLLGALLHIGNDSNKGKLVVGRNWGEASQHDMSFDSSRWDRFFDRMVSEGVITKADMDLVQSIWDLNERLKPVAQRAHYDLFGYYFREVEAKPFEVRFPGGQVVRYRGGYVPAKTDRDLVPDASAHDADKLLEFQRQMPTVPRGFTQSRSEFYRRELDLDLGLTAAHAAEVLLFAHMQPATRDVLRIINKPDVKSVLDRYDPTLRTQVLVPWLQRAAQQTVTQPGQERTPFVDDLLNGLRSNAGLAIMFLNARNALMNFGDMFAVMRRVPARYIGRSIADYVRRRGRVHEEIGKASEAMDLRQRRQVFEIRDHLKEITTSAGWWKRTQGYFRRKGYVLQAVTQNIVEGIAWPAVYNYELERLSSKKPEAAHAEAVKRADAAIRQTQMDTSPEGISRWEAGGSLSKLLFMFQSYFIGKANLVGYDLKAARTEGAGFLAVADIVLFGALLPLVAGEIIGIGYRAATGEDQDKDGDGAWADDVATRIFASTVSGVLNGVPVVGRGAQLVVDVFADNNAWNDRMPAPPVVSMLQRGLVGVRDLPDGEIRDIRNALALFGLMTGVPVNRLAEPALFLAEEPR